MERITNQELERFNTKWFKRKDCKIWNAPLDKDGYGYFYFKKKNRRAHRVAYYMSKGDIPAGMVIDHLCRNRNCVEVSHLRLVTVRENSLFNTNSIAAQNARKTHCKYGHPFDRKYGGQRYCSVCSRAKSKRLRIKWRAQANSIKC